MAVIEIPSTSHIQQPKLRVLQPTWVQHNGGQYIDLRDPLGIASKGVLIPQQVAPLLTLIDGSRTIESLRHGFALRSGIQLTANQLDELVRSLDSALLLEGDTFNRAYQAAINRYRRRKSRAPSHAGHVYPSTRPGFKEMISGYVDNIDHTESFEKPVGELVGMVSPHIDYARGGASYARLWESCKSDLQDIDIAIILGTDHHGGLGKLSPTRQNYRTPYGVIPTARDIVDGLAKTLGQSAYTEELHHLQEHSIELAVVWLHHYFQRALPIVPILCGSFHHITTGDAKPDSQLHDAIRYLRQVVSEKRTLIVAAGDLAHVGPAFDDPEPLNLEAKRDLKTRDAKSIASIERGDAEGFLQISREEQDSRRICGIPPIYMMLSILEDVSGVSVGYNQCPADISASSVVSIVGTLLYKEHGETTNHDKED